MAKTQPAAEHQDPPPVSGRNGDNVLEFDRSDRLLSDEPSPLDLAKLIEAEIIPRLLIAHRDAPNAEVIQMNTGVIEPAELERFSRQVMVADLPTLLEHIDLLVRRGVSVDTVYFDLLSPAAKRLGEMWEADDCTFTDVTIGLCRLQQLVYEFADRVHVENGGGDGRTALFALTPGDHHTFGLVLVVEYFRRAGWRTVCMPDATTEDLIETVRSERFDLVGFSMANERWLSVLPPVITAVRTASANPELKVIVGGRAFEADPSRVETVGADHTAGDAREAVQIVDAIFRRQRSAG